jgi:hypothetical protein
MNHAAICIDCKFTFRENHNDEERNQEGCKEGREEGPSQKEEVTTQRLRISEASKFQTDRPRVSGGVFFFREAQM